MIQPANLLQSNLDDDLPELGDHSATVLSPLQEQQIAEEIMRDVYRSSMIEQDPEIQDYVNQIGQRLAASSPDKRQIFRFFVVKDRTINAFAMPGGVIGVHTGLLIAANNESEVAGVLGHEIGHVVQRHLARMMAKQKQDSILNIATMALALLAARANPQLGSGALAAASAGGIQKQLDYTREHEREADRVGMQILSSAGYDSRGMSSFFEVLQQGSRFSDGAAPAFLRTHPLTSERIADVRSREAEGNYKMQSYSPDFEYIKAKLIAQQGDATAAMARFKDQIAQRRFANEAAQYYGLAIASQRALHFSTAESAIIWLMQNAAAHPMILHQSALLLQAQGKLSQAVQRYKDALREHPNHRGLHIDFIKLLMQQGQTQEVLKAISRSQYMFPDDPFFDEMAAQAHAMQGHMLLSHQAQGEAYLKKFSLEQAVEQFDIASKAGDGDFYQQSIVEARLRELKLKIRK